ncbi:type II CRISPR RNA-guided endonuclease Cas9 [Metamycoplasma spumans]|uniref:type II CRISPR RNA-guided endonuclease Cas9 n=1 Tax=Metamycoplasma spumans TaxID=92406 RepID=UPI0034DD258C
MENNKKIEVSLGLDLGIGSVGWSLVNNETNEVIALGSRLFDEPNLAEDRRAHRSLRRSIRRKALKKNTYAKLVIKYSKMFNLDLKSVEDVLNIYLKSSQKNPHIINLKYKALSEEISSEELIWILHDYLKNRGVFYEIEDETKDKKDGDKNKSSFAEFKDDSKYPSEIEKKYFDRFGFVKNIEANTGNLFTNKRWVAELEKLFEVQSKKYDQKLFKEFSDKYLNLFKYIRSFEQGPGNIKSPSEYGIFQRDENGEVIQKYTVIWEKTTGKCSVFKKDNRAPINTPSAEMFNLLHNLNNTTFYIAENSQNKINLDNQVKKDLILNWFNSFKNDKKVKNIDKKSIIKEMKKINNDLTTNSFSNEDIDYKNLNITNEILNIFVKNNCIASMFDGENLFNVIRDLDKLYQPIFYNRSIDDRINKLNDKECIKVFNKYLLNDSDIQNTIKDIAQSSKLKGNKTHSLSYRVFEHTLQALFDEITNLESLKWNKESDLYKAVSEYNKENEIKLISKEQTGKYLQANFLDDLIVSPAVKSSIRESVKVFNQIIKEFGKEYLITKVGLEMPRDKNGEEEAKKISAQNKHNKKVNDLIEAAVKERAMDNSFSISNCSDHTKLKLLLWLQQDGIDLYSLQDIDLKKVYRDPGYTEIDHILPQSKSFDDSIRNKVLVLKESNRQKKNKVPKDFLSTEKFEELKKWLYVHWKSKADKYSSKKDKIKDLPWFKTYDELIAKYNNLLHDTLSQSDEIEFASRNLNDTRYACKEFLSILANYAKNHDNQFTIKPIRGKFTSIIRKLAQLDKKNRDEFDHHAIDASILAIAANNMKMNSNKWAILENYYIDKNNNVIDKETGEIICKRSDLTVNTEDISDKVRKSIGENRQQEIKSKVRFTRKLTKDHNIELFNATLYSSIKDPNDENIIYKVERKSVYDMKDYFEKEDKHDNVLMFRSHPQEFNKLKNIYLEYKGEKNPFEAYMNDLQKTYSELISEEYKDFCKNNQILLLVENNKVKMVKKLKIVSDKKDINNVALNKNDSKSFKESFNWVALLIYRTRKDKYAYIPVNAIIYTFDNNKKPDFSLEEIYNQKELNRIKKTLDIPEENKIIDVWYKNTLFKNAIDNQVYYLCGAVYSNQTIEVKYISKRNVIKNGEKSEEKRLITTISAFCSKSIKTKNKII